MARQHHITILRIVHGIFTTYFAVCLLYLYYAAINNQFGILLLISMLSLFIEGFLVFVLNKGNCPLIHIQKIIGDDKPFFEIFLPPRIAKKAIPIFSVLTIIALLLLLVSYIFS